MPRRGGVCSDIMMSIYLKPLSLNTDSDDLDMFCEFCFNDSYTSDYLLALKLNGKAECLLVYDMILMECKMFRSSIFQSIMALQMGSWI